MPKLNMACATGSPTEIVVPVAAIMNLDTIDSNSIHITNPTGKSIQILSFGTVSVQKSGQTVNKQLRYDAGIVIVHNPPKITLLSGANRTTAAGDVEQMTGGASGWKENSYGQFDLNSISNQIVALQNRCTALENWKASVLNTGLQTNGYLQSGTNVIVGTSLTANGNISAAQQVYAFASTGSQVGLSTHTHAGGAPPDPNT